MHERAFPFMNRVHISRDCFGQMRSRGRCVILLSLLIACVGSAAVGLHSSFWKRYYFDDSFITYVYADQVARGIGPEFYQGNRVEGYSNFLWMMVVSVARLANICPLLASRVISLLVHFAMLFVITHYLIERFRYGLLMAVVFAGLMASDYAWSFWVASGMETIAYSALVVLSVVTITKHSARAVMMGGWLLSLVSLLRPEGIVFVSAIGIVLLRRNRRGVALASLGLFFLLWTPLLFWRWDYYGALVPNTVMAKGAFWSVARFSDGLRYARDYLFSDGTGRWIIVLFAMVSVVATLIRYRKKGRAHEGSLIAGIAGVGIFVLIFSSLSGGDGAFSFRFLQPVTISAVLLATVGAAGLAERGRSSRAAALLIVAAMLLVGYRGLQVDRFNVRRHELSKKPRNWIISARPFLEQPLDIWHKAAVRSIASRTHIGDAIVMGDVGFTTYVSQCRTIDIFGLNDREVTNYYRSTDHDKDLHYDKIVTKIEIMKPIICFYFFDTERGRYTMELDGRLVEEPRLSERYEFTSVLPIEGFSPRFVLHEYVLRDTSVLDTLDYLDRLREMSHRCPRAMDFYLWAIETARKEGLQESVREWTKRATQALPFWSRTALGATHLSGTPNPVRSPG